MMLILKIIGVLCALFLIILYWYKIVTKLINFYFSKVVKKRLLSIIVTVLLFIPCFNIWNSWCVILLYYIMFFGVMEIIFKIFKIKENKIYLSGIVPLLLTILVLIYGFINMNNIVLKEYTININKSLDKDVKIALIADIHYGISIDKDKLEKYVTRVNNERVDFVILAGDIVDEQTTSKELKEVFGVLSNLKSTYGTYFVYGNHDKSSYRSNANYTVRELQEELQKNNIVVLEDETYTTNNITLVGRKDSHDKNRFSISKISENIDSNNLLILIEHEPSDYKDIEENNYDLVLSGHTHAGQIFPIGILERIFKTSDLIYGYKKSDNLNAIVTSGMAGWGYPIRTDGCSEYVIINIKK